MPDSNRIPTTQIVLVETNEISMGVFEFSGRMTYLDFENLDKITNKHLHFQNRLARTLLPFGPLLGKQSLEITWQANAKFAVWNQLSAGCYLLRSNLNQIDAASFWKRYIYAKTSCLPATFDHHDIVAVLVMADFIHEGSDQ